MTLAPTPRRRSSALAGALGSALLVACGAAPAAPEPASASPRWCTSALRLEVEDALADEVALVVHDGRLHVFHAQSLDRIAWTTLDPASGTTERRTLESPMETARPVAAAAHDDGVVVALRTADGRRVALVAASWQGVLRDLALQFHAEPGERVRAALAHDGSSVVALTDGLGILHHVQLGVEGAPHREHEGPVAHGPSTLWLDAEWVAITGRLHGPDQPVHSYLWNPVDGATLEVPSRLPLAPDERLLDVSFDAGGSMTAIVRTEGTTRLRVTDADGVPSRDLAVPDGTRVVEWAEGEPILVVPGLALEALAVHPDRPHAEWVWPAHHPVATARTPDGELWVVDGRATPAGTWTLGTHRVRCASP